MAPACNAGPSKQAGPLAINEQQTNLLTLTPFGTKWMFEIKSHSCTLSRFGPQSNFSDFIGTHCPVKSRAQKTRARLATRECLARRARQSQEPVWHGEPRFHSILIKHAQPKCHAKLVARQSMFGEQSRNLRQNGL